MRSGEYNNVQLQDLCEAMFRVTKISRSYLGGDDPEVWVNWWDVGRSKASQQFELAYANWRSSLEGPDRDKMYQNLLDLGIMALPFAIEKISAEKNQSLPVQIGLVQAVDYWTGGQVMKEISKRRYPLQYWSGICCKWWDARKNEWLLPPLETKADR